MSFNPDTNKQAQEVIFSRQTSKTNDYSLHFHKAPVSQTSSKKHLRLNLDEKLNFNHYMEEIISIHSKNF